MADSQNEFLQQYGVCSEGYMSGQNQRRETICQTVASTNKKL